MIGVYDETQCLESEQEAVILQAAEAAFAACGKRGSADIFIVDEDEIRTANREHRNRDSGTDVLSFPAMPAGEAPADGYWGDIVLCLSRARAQAEEYGHTLQRELAFLTAHGLLHLLGYDHEREEEEMHMRKLQTLILERMNLK